MEFEKDERKSRKVWRKYLHHETDGQIFGGKDKFAGVFCIHEVSGYAVWYLRNLNDGTNSGVPGGSFLLRFFAPDGRHSAIEFAVRVSRPELSAQAAIAALDEETKNAMAMQATEEIKPPFETVR